MQSDVEYKENKDIEREIDEELEQAKKDEDKEEKGRDVEAGKGNKKCGGGVRSDEEEEEENVNIRDTFDDFIDSEDSGKNKLTSFKNFTLIHSMSKRGKKSHRRPSGYKNKRKRWYTSSNPQPVPSDLEFRELNTVVDQLDGEEGFKSRLKAVNVKMFHPTPPSPAYPRAIFPHILGHMIPMENFDQTSAANPFQSAGLSSPGSVWSVWGLWSHCSVTCGKGTEVRRRACLVQVNGSVDGRLAKLEECPGVGIEKRLCVHGLCSLTGKIYLLRSRVLHDLICLWYLC